MTQTITSFDKPTLRSLRPAIEEALQQLGEEYGIAFKVGSASFNESVATFKLEVATKDESGNASSKIAEDFKALAYRYGLEPDDLGRQFEFQGNLYTLVGAKPRSTKYPLIGQKADGRNFKFPKEGVQRGLVERNGSSQPEPEASEESSPGISNGLLQFNKAQVKKLLAKLKARDKIQLVGDQGVYLMSSSEKTDNRTIIYAEGCHPDKDEDWYDNKRSLYGGDDGVDDIGTASNIKSIVDSLTGRKLSIQLTEDQIIVNP